MKKLYIMALLLLIIIICIYVSKIKIRDFSVLKDTNATKLMIVAHPDDEILFASSMILNDDYLVVCITCGDNYLRVKEFKKVMKYTKDDYIMLSYPDKVKGKRSNWEHDKKNIIKDLNKIINYKNWKMIVTHNPKGEYGHIHHKMVDQMVTDLTDKNKLYYFGAYYKKDNIPDNLETISDENLKNKKYIIDNLYKSQTKILDGMSHIYNHEKIIKYEEWKKLYE